MTSETVVIAGSGQAGFQAAMTLREAGFDGGIILVGDEPGLPYQRPPLSKAYLKSGNAQALELRPRSFFETNRIDLEPGARAAGIDRRNRRLQLTDGRQLCYDRLVLALGARNRALGVHGEQFENILALRSISDADRLRSRLAAAERVVVVGGGFIGLEISAVARAAGKDVTLLEAQSRLLSRSVTEQTAKFLLDMHIRNGTRILLNAVVNEFVGHRSHAVAARLGDGRRLEGDLFVVAIGIVPNVELAAQAGLAVENGILVDRHLRTTDPLIFAVGDCASMVRGGEGSPPLRLESVQNAVDQGKTAARFIADGAAAFDAIPWFWSDQGALRLQIAGLTTGATEVSVPEELGPDQHVVHCFGGGRYIGAETVNAPREHILARRRLSDVGPVT